MKRTSFFLMFFLYIICASHDLLSSENQEDILYFETVSKLFKPSEILNKHEPYKLSNQVKEQFQKTTENLIRKCSALQKWSLKQCIPSQNQKHERSEKERRALEEIQNCTVIIWSRVLDALEKIDCFIPVSQETYERFPIAQWNSENKNRLKLSLETSLDNGIGFYNIKDKYYMVLYQSNIDACDRLLKALYGQKFEGLIQEESKHVEKSFASIRKDFETVIDFLSSDKKQIAFKNDVDFDLPTIQELLK